MKITDSYTFLQTIVQWLGVTQRYNCGNALSVRIGHAGVGSSRMGDHPGF